jgi:hypothetical protein
MPSHSQEILSFIQVKQNKISWDKFLQFRFLNIFLLLANNLLANNLLLKKLLRMLPTECCLQNHMVSVVVR